MWSTARYTPQSEIIKKTQKTEFLQRTAVLDLEIPK